MTVINFQNLPRDLFLLLRTYFIDYDGRYLDDFVVKENLKDWRNFVNCNKFFVKEIKRHYGYYNLNKKYSLAYLQYNYNINYVKILDGGAKSIMERLNSLIDNPKQQLQLTYSLVPMETKDSLLAGFVDPLLNFDQNKEIVLNIHSFRHRMFYHHGQFQSYNSSDASILKGVYRVNLSNCRDLIDVSALKDCKIICLYNCGKVEDVSMLGDAIELNVSHTKVSDVKNLGKVERIYMEGCEKIQSILPLKNARRISLSANSFISGLSSLTSAVVRDAYFSDCPAIIDISPLSRARTVHLSYCSGIADVSSLMNVHSVSLCSCDKISDVTALSHVHKLHISDCCQIHDIRTLGNVVELHLHLLQIHDFLPNDNKVKILHIDSSYLPRIKQFIYKENKIIHVYNDFIDTYFPCFEGYKNVTIYYNKSLSKVTIPSVEVLRVHCLTTDKKKIYFENMPFLYSLSCTSLIEMCEFEYQTLPNLYKLRVDGTFNFFHIYSPIKECILDSRYLEKVFIHTNLILLEVNRVTRKTKDEEIVLILDENVEIKHFNVLEKYSLRAQKKSFIEKLMGSFVRS